MLIHKRHIGDIPALETQYLGAYCCGELVQAAINSLVWMAMQGMHICSMELVHNVLWYSCNSFCNVFGVGRGFLCAAPPFLMPKQRVNGTL